MPALGLRLTLGVTMDASLVRDGLWLVVGLHASAVQEHAHVLIFCVSLFGVCSYLEDPPVQCSQPLFSENMAELNEDPSFLFEDVVVARDEDEAIVDEAATHATNGTGVINSVLLHDKFIPYLIAQLQKVPGNQNCPPVAAKRKPKAAPKQPSMTAFLKSK